MTPEEIIENAEKMRAGETAMPLDPLERRVFRLETQKQAMVMYARAQNW